MAFILKDRVKESTTTTGTGNISLGGASATFDTFQSYLTNGDTTFYAIAHTSSGVDEWEVGLGTWNTGNTLSRTTVLAGSNGTSAVDLSAGTKDIFMTYPASKAAVVGEDVTFADITVTGTVDGRDVAADGSKLDGIDTSADVTDAVTVAAAGALMRSGGTMTGNLILNTDPNAALGAATKQYVDTIASAGIHYHAPVRAEHPSNLNATYNNGSSGVGATLTNAGTNAALVIDSVSMVLNDRVLVANQTNQTQNGVYTVTTVGDGSTAWVLTRSTDTDTAAPSDPDAFGKGDAFFIKEGSTNAGHLDVLSTAGTIVFGTTNIVFSEVAETTVYSGGTGITLTGTTFSIGQDVATSANVTFNQVTAAIIGNVTGNLTGDVTGNADTATALETARTIQLSGDVTGSASFDGSANINITAAVQDDSHAHVISNVDGLQSALDAKVPTSRTITAGNGLTGGGDLSANRTLNVGAGSGITVSANDVAHADTSTQASINNSGRTYIQDITLDGFGHVTGLTSATETVTDTTYSAGSGLSLSGTTFSHTDTSSQASVNNSNGTVIQDITLDTYGHITGINSFNLDGRYYTETEADSRFANVSGDTFTGNVSIDAGTSGDAILTIRSDTDNNGEGDHPSVKFLQDGDLVGYRIGIGASDGDVSVAESGNGLTITNTTSNSFDSFFWSPNNGTNAYKVFHDSYHPNADKWTTSRTLSLSGDASGSVSWDGSANATLSVTVANDSHNHNHSDGGFTVNGTLAVTGVIDVGSQVGTWIQSNVMTDAIGWNTNYGVYIGSDIGGTHYLRGNGTFTTGGSTYNLWHAGNDGSGSGLDADTVDGIQGSSFLRSDAADTASGTVSFTGEPRFGASYSDPDSGVQRDAKFGDNGIAVLGGIKTDTISITNDGSGSGLDADLLDGVQGSSFLRSDADDTYAGNLTVNGITLKNNSNVTRNLKLQPSSSTTDVGLSMFYGNGSHGLQLYGSSDYYGFLDGNWASWDIRKQKNGNFEVDEGSGLQRVFNNGYHPNADKWTTARTLSLSGDASGSVSWDGSSNATLSANITSINNSVTFDGGTSTTINIKCDDGGLALVRANGDSQGTGALEVGQSNSYGGGISYNGDGSPAFVSGETSDNITFYRLENGTRTEVFHYPYNSSTVNFNGSITLGGTVDGRDVAADGTKLDTIATNANNYVHPTGNGNNHIPSGGQAETFLKYSSAGTATWSVPWTRFKDGDGDQIYANHNHSVKFKDSSSISTNWVSTNPLNTDWELDINVINYSIGHTKMDIGNSGSADDVTGAILVNDGSNGFNWARSPSVTDIYVSDAIIHTGDTDTKIRFNNNEISLQAEGLEGAKIQYGKLLSPNFYVNGTNAGSTQVLTSSAGSVQLRNIASLDSTTTSTIQAVAGGGATGGGSDEVFYENGQTVTTNYTITNNKNAMSAGPITVNSGVTVTVGDGETWTVV